MALSETKFKKLVETIKGFNTTPSGESAIGVGPYSGLTPSEQASFAKKNPNDLQTGGLISGIRKADPYAAYYKSAPTQAVRTPQVSYSNAGINGVGGFTAYGTEKIKAETEEEKRVRQLEEAQLKQQDTISETQRPFWERFMSSPSREETIKTAQKESGINKARIEEQAAFAQLSSKQNEYNRILAARDSQIAKTQDVLGSTNFINNQIAQINRNAAPEINRLSADINTQAAVLAYRQNKVEEANKFVNQAVDAMVADKKDALDYINAIIEMNQPYVNLLSDKYKSALEDEKLTRARTYETSKDEVRNLINLRIDNPQAGITDTDTLEQAFEKVRKNPKTSGDIVKDEQGNQFNIIRDSQGNIVNRIQISSGVPSDKSGKYSTRQDKMIDQINTGVSNSFSFKAVNSARAFSDGVVTSLNQRNGLSDIAAINQFQKVIDEGAVTRDQDVRLVQGAQSLVNSLKTKVKKLEKGDQLSDEQRNTMANTVKRLYEAKVNALNDDPYLKSQIIKAKQNDIDTSDTILGQLGIFSERKQGGQVITAPDGTLIEITD